MVLCCAVRVGVHKHPDICVGFSLASLLHPTPWLVLSSVCVGPDFFFLLDSSYQRM